MPPSPRDDWSHRWALVLDAVEDAEVAADQGAADTAALRARKATEALLRLLADAHGVEIPSTAGPTTLGTLRKALRHRKLLSRRVEDHVATVQHIGNRAAHAQPDAALEVDPDEAVLVVGALWQVVAGVDEALPPHARSTPPAEVAAAAQALGGAAPPTPLAWWLLVLAAGGIAVAFAFLGGTALLARMDGDAPVPADTDGPLVDAARLDALLDPVDVAARVRDGARLAPIDVDGGDCATLTDARAWIWARHGYVFDSPALMARLEASGAYVGDAMRSRRDVERRFTDADEANLTTLSERLGTLGCACPRPGRKRAPCPE